MANITDDILRSRYQQTASLFLLSNLPTHDKVHQGKGTRKKNEFDPIRTAKSLMLRSIYAHSSHSSSGHNEDSNYSQCILPGEVKSNLQKEHLNHWRSGARIMAVPVEKLQQEYTKFEEQFQELKTHGQASSTLSIQDKANLYSQLIDTKHGVTNSSILNNDFSGMTTDLFCPACGLPYFTPFPNKFHAKVRLKSLKSSRTKRRRASRYNATRHSFENNMLQKHKGGGKKFATASSQGLVGGSNYISHGSAVATMMETKVALKQKQEIRRVNDGISKHCIVYTCSYCGHQQSFKGLRRRNNNDRAEKIDQNAELAKGANTKHNMSQKKTLIIQKRKRGQMETGNDTRNKQMNEDENGDDFLPFSTVATTKNIATKQKPTPLMSSNKKRQKKPNKGKSALMDFLSSLND